MRTPKKYGPIENKYVHIYSSLHLGTKTFLITSRDTSAIFSQNLLAQGICNVFDITIIVSGAKASQQLDLGAIVLMGTKLEK